MVSPLARFSATHNLSRSAADARAFDSQAVRGQAQARNVRVIITGGKTGLLNLFKDNAEVHAGKINFRQATVKLVRAPFSVFARFGVTSMSIRG